MNCSETALWFFYNNFENNKRILWNGFQINCAVDKDKQTIEVGTPKGFRGKNEKKIYREEFGKIGHCSILFRIYSLFQKEMWSMYSWSMTKVNDFHCCYIASDQCRTL